MRNSDLIKNAAYRGLIILVFVTVVFGLSRLAQPSDGIYINEHITRDGHTVTEQAIEPSLPKPFSSRHPETCEQIADINYRDAEFANEDVARCDLKAQRQMALLTGVIAALTFVGLIVLWQTLRATRATLIEAEKATHETRRIGEAQTRAYLSVIGGEFSLERALPMTLPIMILIHNSGNSPADSIKVCAEVCFEGYDEAPDRIFRQVSPELPVDEIGSQVTYPREIVIDSFDIGQLDHLLEGQHDVGIHGTIEYRHVFMQDSDSSEIVTFALSGWIRPTKAKWERETVTMALNTCRHDRWRKQSA